LQSRYGMGALQILRLNSGYGLVMYLVAVASFFVTLGH
jgi:hypothetical protein